MKDKITPRGMVLYVLGMYPDNRHSITEIQKKIFKHFGHKISWQTTINAINEHDYVGGNIIESSERRGSSKIPTKVYTIQSITQPN